MKNKKYIVHWFAICIIHIMIWLFACKYSVIGGDAFFSYGLANETEGFLFWDMNQIESHTGDNGWIKGEEIYSYLVVDENETFAYHSVWDNQAKDVHPPLFYAFLNTVCSFFTGHYSKWFGFIINIVVAVFIDVLVYQIAQQIGLDEKQVLLLTFLQGITPGILQLVSYVRMYALLNLWCILLIWAHIRLMKRKDGYTYAILIVTVLCGGLTHYFFWVFAAICFGGYIVHLYIQKEFRVSLGKYVCSFIIGGILSIIIFPKSISHMFFGNKGEGIIGTFFSTQFYGKEYINILNESLYCGKLPVIIIIVCLLLLVLGIFNKGQIRELRNTYKTQLYYSLYVFLCGGIYVFAMMKVSSTVTWYYLSPCFSVFWMGVLALVMIVVQAFMQGTSILMKMVSSIAAGSVLCVFFMHGMYSYISENMGYAQAMEEYYSVIQSGDDKDVIFLYDSWDNIFSGKLDFVAQADEVYAADFQAAKSVDWKQCLDKRESKDEVLVLIQRTEDYEKNLVEIQKQLSINLELYQESKIMLYGTSNMSQNK